MANAFVDLHCHWLPGIDDGARTLDEGLEMLRGLFSLGFVHVVATPHMRPGMFDNVKSDLVNKYQSVLETLETSFGPLSSNANPTHGLPEVSLGSEHYFDDGVIAALRAGNGLPYARGVQSGETRAAGGLLVEFHDLTPAAAIERQLFELQTLGYVPVIAHPERYRSVWEDPNRLGRLLDLGSTALLDVAAVVGKYGREAEKCSKKLLELGFYGAACSDAHRPSDLAAVARGMSWIRTEYGQEELDFLMAEAPAQLLDGKRPT